jgi:cyclic beta-1,2-glucan synthetase
MGVPFVSLISKFRRAADPGDNLPIREELFSVERLEQFAQKLAAEHKLVKKRGRVRLLPRLEDNGRKLISAYHLIVEAIRNGRAISPAAEWLIDNFHIVEEQLREIREDLPRGYYHELPKLTEGDLKDLPRIYAVAVSLIAHTDSRLDVATMRRFITAYQIVAPLTIGELWAVAISLRLALVENLRRLATVIVRSRDERELADELADDLLELAAQQSTGLLRLVSERLPLSEPTPQALIVQLMQRLREQDPSVMQVYDWLEKRLTSQGTSVEQVIHAEHQRQAAGQVTVGNIITSMRLLSTLDWRDFFESVSLVDPILDRDPAGAYVKMEFATRDRYRHVIERISKQTKSSELEVAEAAIRLAQTAGEADASQAHVGYYLIGAGLNQLEAEWSCHAPVSEVVRRWMLRHPTFTYLGSLSFLTAMVVALMVVVMAQSGAQLATLIATALLGLIPASDLALGVVNWDLTRLFGPRLLPRMNTAAGIPADARTMIVVPTIFSSEQAVRDLLARIEVHFLANSDQHFYFALLGDFVDAGSEDQPDDAALIDFALAGIEQLNQRYGEQRFHLFHRRRQWNPGEGKWIGWERKRGKLHEFNRLLRGARDTSFTVQTADTALLAQVRYVITLDSDTQLPRDAARKLVGTAIHPLNRARLDPVLKRVTNGYGILQPRVSVSLESASNSRFARIFSGNTGIDPYTTAVSDVYQDLFGEGSYTGKGLYDVDAFEAALNNRVPENHLLSHDLFESLFARAALVSDIELLDDYPANYSVYARRQHRWTRGDWQLLRWLLPSVRDAHGRRVRNNLPLIARWKILDNLRRSLVAPALLLLLIIVWAVVPGGAVAWTTFVILTIAFPVYLHVTTSLLLHPRGIPWTSHFWSVWGDVRTNTAQVLLSIALVPQQSCLMVDAIARTVYRKLISGKKLLEWVTASQTERVSRSDFAGFMRFMWPAEALVIVAGSLTWFLKPGAIKIAAPLLVLWALSPLIAWLVSRPLTETQKQLPPESLRLARNVARRTWRFFETFVGVDDHWLPPDNFQEDPQPVIAHRTSPTNIALLLLSTVAAHDFGYLGSLEFIERQELMFATLVKLRKFRGHFFNWYDTHSLEPLAPQYISTVDSGNLAGHLIALKQACIELPDTKLFEARVIDGLTDTFACISDEAKTLSNVRQRTDVVSVRELRDAIETCQQLLSAATPETLNAWQALFVSLDRRAAVIDDIVGALAHEHGPEAFTDLRWWITALRGQLRSGRRDFDTLVPWGATLISHLEPIIAACGAEVASQWQTTARLLDSVPSAAEIPDVCDAALLQLAALQAQLDQDGADRSAARNGLKLLATAIERSAGSVAEFMSRLSRIAQTAEQLLTPMDFGFLLDPDRKVFAIGYNVTEQRADNSYYDLLASEARLASFVAIAKGDVPQEHWFRMGRQLTAMDGGRALISWTGTMFEYLMPLLVMRAYKNTLLDETYRAIVARQIEYGLERGVPWGISESAYNVRDLQLTYQYGPFGVPGLGLKRGLIEDLVVAPYATILAAIANAPAALENMRLLKREGALANYGFYEAIDYTPERLPQNQELVLIRTFMAHHQGMSLVSLDNVLHDGRMIKRFHADPLVQATELLLQERIPLGVPAAHPRSEEVLTGRVTRSLAGLVTRVYDSADLPTPRTQLLSNGTYHVMLTTAGAGYSVCGPNAVTRWREDPTQDNWGAFIYVRDVRSGTVWSAGHQPIQRPAQSYKVAFSEDKADYWRSDAGVVTHMEVVVSPEDNAEVRRLSITNNTTRASDLELTSYAEVVLAPPLTDAAHPAFSNLFIETEYIGSTSALLARRRQRSSEDEEIWGLHVVVVAGENSIGVTQYETDRGRFLGRGHTPANPMAVIDDRPLSNTVGAVLDPVFSLRRRIRIKPGQTVRVLFTTAVTHSRADALRLADKYHDASVFGRQARLAWTRAQVEMNHLNLDAEEAHLFQRVAGRILYSDPSLRPRSRVLALNNKAQSTLWAHGISGDLPILLVRINREEDLGMVRRILRGHEYLHYKGLMIDLVIMNDHPTSYSQWLHDELQVLIRTSGLHGLQDKPGGVFLRRADIMPEDSRILLHSVARVVIVTDRGSLDDQLARRPIVEPLPPRFVPRGPSQTYSEPVVDQFELTFFNGLGGFHQGGREYVTVLSDGQWTPAPWSNIVANSKDFGFQVSESGGGYTWSGNSRENRLTPWSNNAVSDPPGEAIYIRDEDSGSVWSPTPLPIRESEPYTIRHGQGYTVFEHISHGISQELLLFVPLEETVKFSLLRLRNRTNRRRRLSITSYNELVLGVQRSSSAPYLITEVDAAAGMVFARNPYNNEFAERVAFMAASEKFSSTTCDRREFLGRNGVASQPEGLRRARLAEHDGAGLDPCAAIQIVIDLAPGEAREIVFLLGQCESRDAAKKLAATYQHTSAVNEAFERVLAYWDQTLGTIEVRTPDTAMDTMLNRWLPYQVLSCRVWARTAFYQSGGAYGFRDQLQDVMALVYSQPAIVREQIVRAAGRQFKEGDVQHWWHPPTGRGVRTRFSDDALWLPFVTAFYLDVTGDQTVLNEVIPFLDAPLLAANEVEAYFQPSVASESGTVFEHCARALDRSLRVGAHGLPLMGSGDWNDGMNRVGYLGQGESVWVGWFLYTTLSKFAPLCDRRDESGRSDRYRAHLQQLKKAIEENGWDGGWYRRAYFDDGTPLGSAQNDECRIDSITQTWAVISGAADPQRAARAMTSVDEYLIRRGDGLVILFTPPFDRGDKDPGYIKGYVPGVRENGGQYTHAAIWTIIAFALLGDGDRAGELFSLLNPINHSATRAGLHKYKVEPYVAAGDVYAAAPHLGRGGWTWYTGSASWMYRAGLESILGFQLRADRLTIDPCIPKSWRDYEIVYRRGATTYRIQVENPTGVSRGVASVQLDNELLSETEIPLHDDGRMHLVRIVLGEKPAQSTAEKTGDIFGKPVETTTV